MADYINNEGDLYTIDEINQTAEENNTTFEDIIEKNQLSQNSKKASVEKPGKKKPVVVKDATVAGTKNTVSKSVQPSLASQDNPFGKTKVFDPLNITKNNIKAAQTAKPKQAPVLTDESKSNYTKFDFSALDNTQKPQSFKEYGTSEQFKAKKANEAKIKKEDELLSLQRLKNTALRNTADYQEAINIVSKAGELDDEFNLELDADIQRQKERNGKLETMAVPAGGIAGFGGGGGVQSSYKFSAFPEERKEIVNEFKKQNKKYTEADVVNLAADLYKSKKQKERIYSQKFDAFEDLDGYSDDVQSFVKDYTKNEDKIADIGLAKVVVQKNYTQAAIEKKAKEQALLESKLKPANYKFTSQDEIAQQNELIQKINNGRQELKSSFDHYKSLDETESKLENKSTTLKQDIDLLNKEWGWWNKTGLKTLNAFGSFGGAIAGGAAYLADLGVQAGTLGTWDNSFGNYVSEKVKSNRESFEEQIARPREKFYSIESIGEGAGDAILSQLPVIATVISAPEVFAPELVGLGVGLVSGTGAKYTSMLEEQKYGSFDKEGNKAMPQYSSAQLISVPLLFGALEGGTEYIGGRALSRSIGKWQQLMGKATDKEVDLLLSGVRKSVQKQSSEFATALLQNYGEEVPSEVINQVLGNVTDNILLGKKDVNPLDGVSDVIFDTGVVSTLFGAVPHIAGAIYKPFIASSDVVKLAENNRRIADMLKGVDFEKLSLEEKSIIDSKVSALKDSSSKIINNIAGMVGTTDTQELLDLNNFSKQMIDIKKQAQIINNSSNLSDTQKEAMLSEMKSEYSELSSVYNNKLSRAYRQEQAFKKANSFLNNRKLNKDIKLGVKFSTGVLLENPNTTFTYASSKEIVDMMIKDPATANEIKNTADEIEANDVANGAEKYSAEQKLFTQKAVASQAVNANGWFDPNTNKVYVNKSNALKEGRFNTARHEFFHKFSQNFANNMGSIGSALYDFVKESHSGSKKFEETDFYKRMKQETFDLDKGTKELKEKNQAEIAELKSKLKTNEISQSDFNAALKIKEQKLNNNIKSLDDATYEEVSAILTESLEEKDIQIAKDVSSELKLDKDGNVVFNNAKDVFNFIVAYNESFSKAKESKITEAARKGKVAGELIKEAPVKAVEGQIKLSKPQSEILKQELADLEDNESDYDPDDFDQQVANLEGKIKRAIEKEKSASKAEVIKKEVLTEEDEVKEIIKENRASVASDKVQKIYDVKGKEGAQDIINLFKPITKKIVDKRRDAPGFDRELLTDEIETGVGGILDLINKYNPESGVPLAAYINKYLPVRAIATSKRILDKEFSKDVTEEKGIIAEETVTETKEKPKYANALESKVFEPETLETINKKILSVVRTLKSKIDAPVSMNRTVTPLITEIRDEIGKQVDIDVKTAMGGKKDNQLKNWLTKNKKYILENMTTTWLMGKDGQGGIPIAIQKQIDGKWTNYPDWVGQKIDRETTSTDQAGRTSGAELVRRSPNVNNNISNADFIAQVLEPSGNPIRGRKESLAKAIAEESSFDIINNDFENEGVIFDAFKTNQERLGVEIASNAIADFIRQSERGNIKFSKARMQELNLAQAELANNISINGKSGLNNIRLALITTFPEWEKEDINYVATKLTPSITGVFKQIKTKNKTLPKDLLGKAIENVVNLLDDGVTMRNKFGSKISVAAFFRNPQYRADLKALDLAFSEFILNKYGKKEGSDILSSLWSPTVAGKTSSGKKAPMSIYDGVSEFNSHLEALQRNIGDGKLVEIDQKYKKNNTIFNNNFDGTFIEAKDKLKSDKAKEISVLAAEWFSKEILKEDNNYGPEHLAAIYTLLIKENNSVLRSAAPVVGTITDKRIKNIKKYDYDHSKPVSYVARRLADKFVYGLNVDLDLLFKDYEVTIIPKVVSNKLAKIGLQSMMPIDYVEGSGSAFRINQATTQAVERYEDFISKIDVEQLTTNKAVTDSMKVSKMSKGISVFDFDDTIGLTKSNVLYTMPDGSNGKLNAEEFAKDGSKLLSEGAVFDFSEFSKVTNGKPGPMIDKMKKMIGKFGPENFFILTARPADAAGPIQEFLSSVEIDIPLENITGLGNSTAQAKADWITNKAAEGYNDFYFADDAIQNVTAVKNALDVLDVKSKIQQARIKFSKTISPEFNKIIEENKGVEDYKVFSDIVARRRGADKNKYDFYVPPSAADFELLLYKFIGKGTKGEEQKKFFDNALLKPYANGNDLMDAARQSIKKDYKALIDSFPEVRKKIEKLTPDGDFTYDQAIRVAMWNDEGVDIPGLSQRDSNKLTELVNNDPELRAFKEGLIVMGRQGRGWIKPEAYWNANTIISDLHNLTEGEGRKKFLSEFIDNAEQMFGVWENSRLSGPNINKVEAVYGTNVREAIEDVLWRMTTGKNRGYGKDKETSAWANWVNGSTGTIMFLNTRSAVLQLIGAVNFLNLRDNNPFAAAKAFANQKQYWSDFAYIWNSDKIKERRGGLKEDVAAAEIANAAAGSKNKANAVISYLLKIGYTPTQLADSFAIASGGSPYYRNRINSYKSEYEGLDQNGKLKRKHTDEEAESKAWEDFSKVSDETQQSGDPRDISKQQASPAGRLLLTFQNTAMQQSRIVKKAFLDLKNGRGDTKTNVAKIVYYLGVQNILFATLQQGLFAIGFGGDDDEDKDTKKKDEAKIENAVNGIIDTILSGTGFVGKVVATLKNIAKVYLDEKDKDFKADYAKVVLEGANISPPIGSKLRKLYSGLQQTKFDKDLIKERGWEVMQDGRIHLGPMYGVSGKVVEATTNFPMDRLVGKIENASQAMNSKNEVWQRVMVGFGWNPYSVGIKDSESDDKIKAEAKAKRKIEGVEKAKETRERTKDSIRQLPVSERLRLRKEAALERREKRRRRKMG